MTITTLSEQWLTTIATNFMFFQDQIQGLVKIQDTGIQNRQNVCAISFTKNTRFCVYACQFSKDIKLNFYKCVLRVPHQLVKGLLTVSSPSLTSYENNLDFFYLLT